MLRNSHNPLLTPAQITPSQPLMEVTCLLNPGVFRFNNKIGMLLRVAERPIQQEGKISFPYLDSDGKVQIRVIDKSAPQLDLSDPRVISYNGEDYLTTMSHLRMVTSTDGVYFAEEPDTAPLMGNNLYESYGIEDCRVTFLEGRYYLTYTAVSSNGVAVGMRSTNDWVHFEDHHLILPPHNKDCALFDQKINGKYYLLHRPSSPEIGGNYIWLADSTNLTHWGNHQCIAKTRKGMWDSARIGAGCAPIKTTDGWLMIYHGATEQNRYCLGAMLLDFDRPWNVLARSQDPIMEPTTSYETSGFFGQVIFTNGHLVDGDRLMMYYGAADSVICRADFSLSEIINSLKYNIL